ncbi:MAG: YceI family protein [Gammaproteobacteria bacterium]|nr:MAG: YceI family protein [Gammaproteobacteria bacterium]
MFQARLCGFIRLLPPLLLCGCAAVVERPPPGPPPPAPPAPDARLYRIDSEASELRVLVYRGGPLASLGHNHVISSRGLAGTVWLGADPRRAVFELRLPVMSLEVDRPELRAAEGEDFPGELDQAAIDGTRRNLLGERVLDADHHPQIRLRSRQIRGQAPNFVLAVDVELRGAWHSVEIPATLTRDADRLEASGDFRLRQTDLGIEPFSVMLGALTVQDELTIRYRIIARAR